MDTEFEGFVPNNDYDHVAFELIRVISSIELLAKRDGKLRYAVELAKQALSELDDAETEHMKELN